MLLNELTAYNVLKSKYNLIKMMLSLVICIWVYNGFYSKDTINAAGFCILSLAVLWGFSALYRRVTDIQDNFVCGCIYSGILLVVLYFLISKRADGHSFGVITFVVVAVVITEILKIWLSDNVTVAEKITMSMMFVAVGYAVVFNMINIGGFTPDSMSYYDISRTFFKDFGKVNTVRQYVVKSDYNISFPYFYPLCIYIVDVITGLKIYSGVLFNIFVMLATVIVFLKISKTFSGKLNAGAAALTIMLFNTSYLTEMSAARTIPLAITVTAICAACCAYIYLYSKEKLIPVLAAGVFAGAAAVIRFDGIALMVYCAAVIFVIKKGSRIKSTIIYLAGALLCMLPWIMYSVTKFGTLWVSDNTGTLFLVETVTPDYVFLPDKPVGTFFNATEQWIVALAGKVIDTLKSLQHCSVGADILATALLVMIIYSLVSRKSSCTENIKIYLTAAAIVLFYVAKTAMYAMVGYAAERYHAETVIIVVFVLLLLCEKVCTERYRMVICALVIVTGLIAFNTANRYAQMYQKETDYQPLQLVCKTPWWAENLDKELKANIENKDDEILFLGYGYAFGGWTDWKVYVAPEQMTWESIDYAMKNYMDVEYIVADINAGISDEVYNNLYKDYYATDLSGYILFEIK